MHTLDFFRMFTKVRTGEIIVFSGMMQHEVEVVGADDGWRGRSLSLSWYVRLKC